MNTGKKKLPIKELKLVMRIAFCVLFLILSYNFSQSTFFKEFKLLKSEILTVFLITAAAGLFGFFILPNMLLKLKVWIENLVNRTVTDIVTEFWDQQSKRIQEARREKQKKAAEEAKKKKLEEEKKQKEMIENAIALDTSVLVDGRILDIVKTGFFDKKLIVLNTVINELQTIADNKKVTKRQRGRRGLDVLKDLKKKATVMVIDYTGKETKVDSQLVEYTKKNKIKLMTMDFNLNKVAQVAGVKVLNLNKLVNALKTVVLPGEILDLKIIEKGKEKKQGIAYLEDGTMVVVEGAKEMVGEKIKAKVKKVIQSNAGKMIFCVLETTKVKA